MSGYLSRRSCVKKNVKKVRNSCTLHFKAISLLKKKNEVSEVMYGQPLTVLYIKQVRLLDAHWKTIPFIE